MIRNGSAKSYEEARADAALARAKLRAALDGMRPAAAVKSSPWSAVAIAAAAGFLVGLNPAMARRVGIELARRWVGIP